MSWDFWLRQRAGHDVKEAGSGSQGVVPVSVLHRHHREQVRRAGVYGWFNVGFDDDEPLSAIPQFRPRSLNLRPYLRLPRLSHWLANRLYRTLF